MNAIFKKIISVACLLAGVMTAQSTGALPVSGEVPDYTVTVPNAGQGHGQEPSDVYVGGTGGSVQVGLWWTDAPSSQAQVLGRFTSALAGSGVTASVTRYTTSASASLPQVIVNLTFPALPDGRDRLTVRIAGSGERPSDIIQVPPQSIVTPGRNWTEVREYFGEGASDYVADIVYYNGLGLAEQAVSVAASGSGRSLVIPVTYDSCLRGDAVSWLPYESTASTGVYTASPTSGSRYSSLYGQEESAHAFSETEFDSASLNRPLWTRLPGSAHMQDGRRKTVTYGVSDASDAVRRLVYDPVSGAVSVSAGPSAFISGLTKTVTTDEDGRRSAVFSDSEGRVRLSRAYDRDPDGSYSPGADTYTVYDGAGRPVWVVSPEGSVLLGGASSHAVEGELARKWCTVCRYDGYGRNTARRRPGCGWEEYVYDRSGRTVLERDSTMHALNRWVYHVYDNLGREIERSVVGCTASRDDIQAAYDQCPVANSYPALCSSDAAADYRKPAASIGTFVLVRQLYSARYGGYRYRSSTASAGTSLYTIPASLAFAAVPGVVSASDRSSATDNLKIYERVWIIGDNTSGTSSRSYVERAFHYDVRGRLIETVEHNQAGGISRTAARYDFRDRPLVVSESHAVPGAGTMSRTITRTYDARGRILSERTEVDGLPAATLAYTYDALGRPSSVTCGNGVTQTRTYTVQGWLRNISATKAGGSLLFSETLRYWDSSSATPLYGGVISGTETRNGTSSAIAYDLTYDYLWRLTQVKRPGSNRWAEKGIAYDRNGNISSLKRYGYGGTVTDNLAMAYDGDRLTSVSSGGDVWSYGHDGSGRMTCDGRLEGMTVTYGLTGLLQRTSDPASGADTWYSYLADGTRLGTAQKTGSAATDCDGFLTLGGMNLVHSGSQVSFESSVFGEGVILADGVKYFVRDHLGNTRVVTDGSGSVVERDDYYAFGQRHPYTSHPLLDASRWRFAGKEIQPLGGTGWLDFGARQYDSFIGRWTTMDPLAEKYPSVSPYAYCAGNPVMFVDDGGRDLVIFGANNSSVTFTTDLINLSVRAGGIGIDWKGNHRLDGGETLSAALDLAGLFDPSGIADGTNAVLLASEGRYWDALQSSVSVLPLGDIAKAGRVGKDIGIISEAIGVAVHKHHVIPRAVYRDNAYVLKGVLKKDSAENLLQLPAGFHGNHPAYNKWIQRQILDKTNGNRPLTIEELDVIKRNASREINRALDAYKNGSGLNLNKHFKNLTE